MKIKKLILENITCFEKMELNLNHLTIITGKNESGKTSIVDSLKKLLTGKTELLPREKDRILLQDGAKTGAITAEIDNFTLKRGLAAHSQSLEVSGFSGTMTDVQTHFLDQHKLDPDKILAMLNSISFLKLDAVQKQSILASLLDLNFDFDYLIQNIQDEKIVAWLKSKESFWGQLKGLDLLDTIYDFAYKARRDANKDVKTLNTTVPQIEFSDTLEELREKRGSLTVEQTTYFTSLSEIEKRKKAKEAITKEEEAIEKLEKNIPKMRGDSKQIKYDIELCNSEVMQLISQKQALSKASSEPIEECPIFAVPCPLPAASIKNKAKERAGAIKEIEKKVTEKQKEAGKLSNRLDKLEAKETIYETINKHRANIEEFLEILNESEDKPQSRELDEIQKDMEAVNRKIAELQAADKYKSNIEALQKAQAAAQFYNTVIMAFDPKTGLKAILLKNKIGKLTSGVNQALQAMSDGYSVEILFEPDTQIRILALGKTLPARSLSESAQMRLGIAFQYAFSLISGAKLLVIDRADIFDQENRKKLSVFLSSIMKYFDTMILLHTHNTEEPIQASSQPWITTYYLDGGKCHNVGKELKIA